MNANQQNEDTDIFALLQQRYCLCDPVRQPVRRLPALGPQVPGQLLCLLDGPRDAEPARRRILVFLLAIDAETRVVLTFDEVVVSLESVRAPGRNEEGLVEVIVVATLLVGIFDGGDDGLRSVKGPNDEGAKEVKLRCGVSVAVKRRLGERSPYAARRIERLKALGAGERVLAGPFWRPLVLVGGNGVFECPRMVASPGSGIPLAGCHEVTLCTSRRVLDSHSTEVWG